MPALSDAASWSCPDCSGAAAPAAAAAPTPVAGGELVATIRAIEADATLSDQEKARRRQELLTGSAAAEDQDDGDGAGDDVLDIVGRSFSCSFCMKLPDRPVTVSSALPSSLPALPFSILVCSSIFFFQSDPFASPSADDE